MTNTSQLTFADDLKEAGKFCATIARAKMENFIERGFVPRPGDATATVSFVEYESEVYAVTAKHVIAAFENLASEQSEFESYFLPNGSGVAIQPPFVSPPAIFGERAPDIALRPIERDRVTRVGKLIYPIANVEPPFPIPYALAVGYPSAGKTIVRVNGGDRLQMIGVQAVAEGVGSSRDSDQVQFYSEVDFLGTDVDVSGMSGGPVFWSNGEQHGLLGFVKEAMGAEETTESRRRVGFICQRTSYEIFGRWASYCKTAFPKAREALNEIAKQRTSKI